MFDDPPPPAKKGDFKSLIIVTEFEFEGVASIGVDMFIVVFPEMEDSVETGLARFRVYVNVLDLDIDIAIDEEEGGLA